MTNQKQYRLLDEGDVTQPGDQYFEVPIGRWCNCVGSGYTISSHHSPHRRPCSFQEWPEARSVKDDPPKAGQLILWWDDDAKIWYGATGFNLSEIIWWMPQPPAPPEPVPDWERAFKEYCDTTGKCSFDKQDFRAGYEACQATQKGEKK